MWFFLIAPAHAEDPPSTRAVTKDEAEDLLHRYQVFSYGAVIGTTADTEFTIRGTARKAGVPTVVLPSRTNLQRHLEQENINCGLWVVPGPGSGWTLTELGRCAFDPESKARVAQLPKPESRPVPAPPPPQPRPVKRDPTFADLSANALAEGPLESYVTQTEVRLSPGVVVWVGNPTASVLEGALARPAYALVTQGTSTKIQWVVAATAELAGRAVRVDQIRVVTDRKSPRVELECSFVNQPAQTPIVVVNVDEAMAIGELLEHAEISREVALARLKEAKELLDLGVLTPEQYEAEKAKYSAILLDRP